MRYLFIILALIACNPVKLVMKDPKKFNIIKDSVLRSGACLSDTVIVETFVEGQDSIIKVPCDDFSGETKDSIKVFVKDSVLKYVTIRKVVTNIVRDRSYEDLLKKDMEKRDSIIASFKGSYDKLNEQYKYQRVNTKRWMLSFWLLLIVSLVIIFRKQIIKLMYQYLK